MRRRRSRGRKSYGRKSKRKSYGRSAGRLKIGYRM